MPIQILDSANAKKIEDGKVLLTDINNNTFSIDINNFNDARNFLSSYDINDSNMSSVAFDKIEITKSKSSENVILKDDINSGVISITDSAEMLKGINDNSIVALDVTFEATHSGLNKNSTIYSSDSMEKDSLSWSQPFPKPLIKNHNTSSEPLGRVTNHEFGQSAFCDDRDTINVTFSVFDKDAMIKFADGRYRTMSIGATANTISCNICGATILKDNKFKFCGHWRGESYKDQVATWTAKDLEYTEGSVVNNPADVYAQVKKIRAIKYKDGSTMNNNNQDSVNEDDVLNVIDSMVPNEEPTATVEDGVNETEPTGNEEPIIEDNNTDGELTLEDAKAKIVELEGEIEKLKDSENTLNESISLKDNTITELNEKLAISDKTKEEYLKNSKTLASFNKELLKDKLQLVNSEVTITDMEGKTAKELQSMIDEYLENKNAQRPLATQLANPSALINDSNTIVDVNTETVSAKTMKDMEEVVLNFFK